MWIAAAAIAIAAATAVVWIGGRTIAGEQRQADAVGQQAPFVRDEADTHQRARPKAPDLETVAPKAEPEDPRSLPAHGSAEPEPESLPVAVEPTRAPKRSKPHVPPEAVEPEPPTDSLDAENALLGEARRALAQGDPRRALSLLGEHARRFPDGLLAEERAALRVVGLCSAGQADDGRRAAARFLEAHPASALAGRVRQACPARDPSAER
jgi:hypothetical protein